MVVILVFLEKFLLISVLEFERETYITLVPDVLRAVGEGLGGEGDPTRNAFLNFFDAAYKVRNE